MSLLGRLLGILLCVSTLSAQARDQRTASVGMRAYVEQVVLPGSELQPAPSNAKSPIVVRVLHTWPHGDLLRYDLEWSGFEPGNYDLGKFLVRKDGSTTTGLPPLPVEVTRILPRGRAEPSEIDPKATERLGGYRTLQIVAAIAWVVGLLLILFVGRRFRRRAAPPPAKATLADRLRPLVEAAASGAADNAAKAELERLLLAFWRARLDLREVKAAAAVVAIRQHPEAGALLRQVEAWLHMPEPPATMDLQALLAPYRQVTAESFAAIDDKVRTG